eukprot:13717231-Alexandrium_andersonii.AAC.1
MPTHMNSTPAKAAKAAKVLQSLRATPASQILDGSERLHALEIWLTGPQAQPEEATVPARPAGQAALSSARNRQKSEPPRAS